MKVTWITFLMFLLLFVTVLSVNFSYADSQAEMDNTGVSLGKVNFHISCSPSVHGAFNHGLSLLHHMMYQQAEAVFQSIAKEDPRCAMAHWGIAMTQFHPLWAPPNETALAKGLQAIEKAHVLNPTSPREQAYIKALRFFFKNWKVVRHSRRISAWDVAQKKVYKSFPDDIDAGAFYALSHLSTAEKGDQEYTHQKLMGLMMEKLRVKAPEHPGLFHYMIHAYDNPLHAHRAVKVARDYLKLVPDIPHALHMPSHIFVRLGLWSDVIAWNTRSAAKALKESEGKMTSLHYIHAIDYLMYAYLQQGQDKEAHNLLIALNKREDYQDNFASAYGIAAAQSRYALERGAWGDAATQALRTHKSFPWDKYPWHEAILYFSRGLGAARSGDTAGAVQAIKRLDTVLQVSKKVGEDYWEVQVLIQRLTLSAWVAFSEGKKGQALKKMRQAANIEDSIDKHPVTPGAVLPARDLFGDMLVLMKKFPEALEAYEASLKISPNRFNSLYGAGHAAEQAGNLEKAKAYYAKLVKLTEKGEGERPRIKQAKAFLNKN